MGGIYSLRLSLEPTSWVSKTANLGYGQYLSIFNQDVSKEACLYGIHMPIYLVGLDCLTLK